MYENQRSRSVTQNLRQCSGVKDESALFRALSDLAKGEFDK